MALSSDAPPRPHPGAAPALGARATWHDYFALTKPKVVLLISFTAIVGMFLATPGLPPIGALLFGGAVI